MAQPLRTMSALPPIVLQKSLNAERRFFRLKPKQARTDNKGDSRSITEVTGEFSARLCDPPHPYMKNAPMAQKFCDQGRKTTFATQSGVKRTSGGSASISAFDPNVWTRRALQEKTVRLGC